MPTTTATGVSPPPRTTDETAPLLAHRAWARVQEDTDREIADYRARKVQERAEAVQQQREQAERG